MDPLKVFSKSFCCTRPVSRSRRGEPSARRASAYTETGARFRVAVRWQGWYSTPGFFDVSVRAGNDLEFEPVAGNPLADFGKAAEAPEDVAGDRGVTVGIIHQIDIQEIGDASDIDGAVDQPGAVLLKSGNLGFLTLVGELTRDRL